MNSTEKTPEDIDNGNAKNIPESKNANAALEQTPESKEEIKPGKKMGQPAVNINEQIAAIKEKLEKGEQRDESIEKIHIKPRDLSEVRKEVDKIDEEMAKEDKRGNEVIIDKKIRELVIGLRRWNIRTKESCEGHRIKNPRHRYPFVTFYEKDKKIVEELLRAYGHDKDWEITVTADSNFWELRPKSLKGQDGFIYLPRLSHYQKEVLRFQEWLLNIPDDYDFSK